MLSGAQVTNPRGESGRLYSNFFEPQPLYFDGKFSTKFEGCIKDKFKGLNKVNEVRSDYVKRGLIERNISLTNKFFERLLADDLPVSQNPSKH